MFVKATIHYAIIAVTSLVDILKHAFHTSFQKIPKKLNRQQKKMYCTSSTETVSVCLNSQQEIVSEGFSFNLYHLDSFMNQKHIVYGFQFCGKCNILCIESSLSLVSCKCRVSAAPLNTFISHLLNYLSVVRFIVPEMIEA